jgi:hypothetical protein
MPVIICWSLNDRIISSRAGFKPDIPGANLSRIPAGTTDKLLSSIALIMQQKKVRYAVAKKPLRT